MCFTFICAIEKAATYACLEVCSGSIPSAWQWLARATGSSGFLERNQACLQGVRVLPQGPVGLLKTCGFFCTGASLHRAGDLSEKERRPESPSTLKRDRMHRLQMVLGELMCRHAAEHCNDIH